VRWQGEVFSNSFLILNLKYFFSSGFNSYVKHALSLRGIGQKSNRWARPSLWAPEGEGTKNSTILKVF
jgi:hypothetical protein